MSLLFNMLSRLVIVWMWELFCEESRATKNWCFWTVVLEKTLESPLDCKETQPVHPKDQSWGSLEGLMLNLKLQYLATWCEELTHMKRPWCWEDWRKEEKETTEDKMVGQHHWFNGHGFGWTPGVGDGQGGLVCCGSWGRKDSNTTELNWTESSITFSRKYIMVNSRFWIFQRTVMRKREREEQNWRTHTSQFQNLKQSNSNQNSVVLVYG